jgi:hypothetical protein
MNEKMRLPRLTLGCFSPSVIFNLFKISIVRRRLSNAFFQGYLLILICAVLRRRLPEACNDSFELPLSDQQINGIFIIKDDDDGISAYHRWFNPKPQDYWTFREKYPTDARFSSKNFV